MLFNSVPFLAIFLPITLVTCFLLAARASSRAALAWLAFASLVFYGYWRLADVPVLLGSVMMNYCIGRQLQIRASRLLLIFGVAANLLLLGFFKYLIFLTVTANAALGAAFTVPQIILPLGISFYTFQQIAYLVDSHGGVVKERNPLDYLFFVSFFPQLIAGPIVHHKEIMPQLREPGALQPRYDRLAIGITIFAIGLVKKVVIAGSHRATGRRSLRRGRGRNRAQPRRGLGRRHSLRLADLFRFFRLLGYGDRLGAHGRHPTARQFRLTLQGGQHHRVLVAWHVTLTRFLTAYIYNPLAVRATRRRAELGKPLLRKGNSGPGAFLAQLAVPAMATMLLSGLWHGAGFQFILWGGLHGLYITVNHGWRMLLRPRLGWSLPAILSRPLSVLVTFIAVVVALVFFRAASIGHGWAMLTAMLGANGIVLPPQIVAALGGLAEQLAVMPGHYAFLSPTAGLSLGVLLAAVWLLPNTQEIMARHGVAVSPGEEPRFTPMPSATGGLRLSPAFGLAVGAMASVALLYTLSAAPSRFIYFNF